MYIFWLIVPEELKLGSASFQKNYRTGTKKIPRLRDFLLEVLFHKTTTGLVLLDVDFGIFFFQA